LCSITGASLGEGTHAMALEKHRVWLIREVQQFLEA
jgi:hypothetical protein